MPEISRFYGIIIRMHAQDHPPPHFHADYGGQMAQIDIHTAEILEGSLPRRALRLVQDWTEVHRQALLAASTWLLEIASARALKS